MARSRVPRISGGGDGCATARATSARRRRRVDDTRTREQRCHDGRESRLEAGMESGARAAPGPPVTVIVTTTLGEPRAGGGAGRRTGGRGRLPDERRHPDGRRIDPVPGGVRGPLAARPCTRAGRTAATADHRIVCYARDRGCTKPNCFEPGYHSEVHHARPWSQGGPTDADNLYFGCACDHTMATEGTYTTTVTEDGRIAWGDGTGPPRVNDVHHRERHSDRMSP